MDNKLDKIELLEKLLKSETLTPESKDIVRQHLETTYSEVEALENERDSVKAMETTLDNLRSEEARIIRTWERETAIAWGFAPKPREGVVDAEEMKLIPIHDVVDHFEFKRRGDFICCPIHGEKTPSLKLYKPTNSFYCFGCHKGGSVIDFVMGVEDVDFRSALEILNNIK